MRDFENINFSSIFLIVILISGNVIPRQTLSSPGMDQCFHLFSIKSSRFFLFSMKVFTTSTHLYEEFHLVRHGKENFFLTC